MSWLQSFLEESPGVGSMARAVHWWAFVCLVAAPAALELLLSWRAGAWVEIPSTVSVFLLGGFGTATAAKVGQSIFAEKGSQAPAP